MSTRSSNINGTNIEIPSNVVVRSSKKINTRSNNKSSKNFSSNINGAKIVSQSLEDDTSDDDILDEDWLPTNFSEPKIDTDSSWRTPQNIFGPTKVLNPLERKHSRKMHGVHKSDMEAKIHSVKELNKISENNDLKTTVHQSLSHIFPGKAQNTDQYVQKDFNTLVSNVSKYITEHHVKESLVDVNQQVEIITETLLDLYPKQNFFHLLHRWGRRKKISFVNDALNSTKVINDLFPERSLINLIFNCRSFGVKPKTQRSEKASFMFNDIRDPNYAAVILKINASCDILYSSVTTVSPSFMTSLRMDSINHPQQFPFPTRPLHDNKWSKVSLAPPPHNPGNKKIKPSLPIEHPLVVNVDNGNNDSIDNQSDTTDNPNIEDRYIKNSLDNPSDGKTKISIEHQLNAIVDNAIIDKGNINNINNPSDGKTKNAIIDNAIIDKGNINNINNPSDGKTKNAIIDDSRLTEDHTLNDLLVSNNDQIGTAPSHYNYKAKPLIGLHLPHNFRKRLLDTNLHHLKMALYLYMFVFQHDIAVSGLYNDCPYALTQEEKVFQYMVNSMAGLTTSRLFVTFLYKLALHFKTLASIKCSSAWIKTVITPPPGLTNIVDDDDDDELSWESAMVPSLELRVDTLWSYKKESILHAYTIVNRNSRSYIVDNFRTCHDQELLERHYQGLRCHIFQCYFKSESNSVLEFKKFVYSDFPRSELGKAKSRKRKNNVEHEDYIFPPITIPFIVRPDLPVITQSPHNPANKKIKSSLPIEYPLDANVDNGNTDYIDNPSENPLVEDHVSLLVKDHVMSTCKFCRTKMDHSLTHLFLLKLILEYQTSSRRECR